MLTPQVATQEIDDDNLTLRKRNPAGNWEIHSWGRAELPGCAAVSAITALQVGATLAKTIADQIAMNKAAEYLTQALAPQLKSFRQAMAADQLQLCKKK
jgi:hypothetical protein